MGSFAALLFVVCCCLFVVRGLLLLLHSINEQRHFESSAWGSSRQVKSASFIIITRPSSNSFSLSQKRKGKVSKLKTQMMNILYPREQVYAAHILPNEIYKYINIMQLIRLIIIDSTWYIS